MEKCETSLQNDSAKLNELRQTIKTTKEEEEKNSSILRNLQKNLESVMKKLNERDNTVKKSREYIVQVSKKKDILLKKMVETVLNLYLFLRSQCWTV